MELTSAMEELNLPPDGIPDQHAAVSAPSHLADHTPWRPYDSLGPPADSVKFPQPRYCYGKRADVLCYNPETGKHEVVKNVLFRDYSKSSGSENDDSCDNLVREAYWRVPYKQLIKTIMGHVEICLVLERCLRQHDADDDSLERSDSENGDDEEDIVFQWTQRRVAVKVNYCDRMERLRNRHAEDPRNEIAAMQLIGDRHPNVLGCKEVLFDGKNLNVVMRYCDSGDLFQLLQDNMANGSHTGGCPGISEGQARYWFRQIMAGVQHLHSVGVCHRDLSPENVMIDQHGSLIIDMGMCLRVAYCLPHDCSRQTDIAEATRLSHAAGTAPLRCLFKPQGACGKLPYMSPEIYKNRTSFDGSAVDVWTAGTILFCMVTGNRSYQRPHSSDPQFYWMTRGLPQLLSDWRVILSPEGVHLLQNMLQVEARLRLTLDEVVNHRWFTMPDELPKLP
jgi:serine/threonine protein kinase